LDDCKNRSPASEWKLDIIRRDWIQINRRKERDNLFSVDPKQTKAFEILSMQDWTACFDFANSHLLVLHIKCMTHLIYFDTWFWKGLRNLRKFVISHLFQISAKNLLFKFSNIWNQQAKTDRSVKFEFTH